MRYNRAGDARKSVHCYYSEDTGPFKGTAWSINWVNGYLVDVITNDTDRYFVRTSSTARWVGGNRAVLRVSVEVTLKGTIDYSAIKTRTQEIFIVELASASNDIYDMDNPNFNKCSDLSVRWYPVDGIENSMLYGKITGNSYLSPLTPSTRPSTFDVTKDDLVIREFSLVSCRCLLVSLGAVKMVLQCGFEGRKRCKKRLPWK